MENITKRFTDEEILSIKTLQQKYQDKLILFGQLNLERLAIEKAIKDLSEAETTARKEYADLQSEEEVLLESLSSKYGNGSLNLKDGTFTPIAK
jgi:hypothetical protein